MSLRSFAEVGEFFLRDLFAFLVPGVALLLALRLLFGIHVDDALNGTLTIPPNNASDWIIAVVASYVLGAAMQSVGEHILVGTIDRFGRTFGNVQPKCKFVSDTTAGASFTAAREQLSAHLGFTVKGDLHEVRNLAMSVAPDRISEVYRNMYTSQLCLGVAVALLLASVGAIGCVLFNPVPVADIPLQSRNLIWVAAFVPTAALLLDRRYRYYSISMRLPIHIALARMHEHQDVKDPVR